MESKVCTACELKKEVTEYNFKDKPRNKRQARCRKCVKERDAQNYRNNIERFTERNNRIKERTLKENRKKLLGYLKEHPCIDCGEADLIVLEFDHRRNSKEAKKYEIGNMMGKCCWKTIIHEIEKCDVRCANCHRIKTSKENGHYRWIMTR